MKLYISRTIFQFQIVEREPCHSAPPKPSERSKSAGVDTRRSADSKRTKITVKSQSTSHVSSKPDSTKVLSYLKKNRYDDKGEWSRHISKLARYRA